MSYSFAGVTGKSGMTGAQVQKKCLELGFYNAIMLDGGGSVFREYLGKYDISTTRKVKNALILYRRKKKADTTPAEPSTPAEGYKAKYEELKSLYDKLQISNDALNASYKELEAKYTQLETNHKALSNENVELTSELQNATVLNNKLQDKLDKIRELVA